MSTPELVVHNHEGYAFTGSGTVEDPHRKSQVPHKRVVLEVTCILDLVPGAWHDPNDFINWLMTNPYVETIAMKGE